MRMSKYNDVVCNLELDAEQLKAGKSNISVHMTDINSNKVSKPKCKYPNQALEHTGPSRPPPERAKIVKRYIRGMHSKKENSKLTCYNYEKNHTLLVNALS